MTRTSRGWLITARGRFGTLADVVSILTAAAAVWTLIAGAPVPQAILAVFLGLLAITFMALSFQLQRKQARELADALKQARHSDSLTYMTQSASYLRDAITVLAGGGHPATFTEPANQSVASLAQAMSVATGCKCRVVVKSIYAPGERADVAVKNFAHSEPKASRTSAGQQIDWVKENTDFDEIFYRDRDVFLSNDLASELGYKNSHFTRDALQAGYPYQSTIVWPIYGYEGDEAQILGFLCIDSKVVDAFDPERDVAVGELMASFWYLALKRYKESLDATSEAPELSPSPSDESAARSGPQRSEDTRSGAGERSEPT